MRGFNQLASLSTLLREGSDSKTYEKPGQLAALTEAAKARMGMRAAAAVMVFGVV